AGRTGLPGGRPDFGGGLPGVRDSVFTATHPGAGAATVSGLDSLSAAVVGGDGFGQGKIIWKRLFTNFHRTAGTSRSTSPGRTGITRTSALGANTFFRPTTKSSASNTASQRCVSCCSDFS